MISLLLCGVLCGLAGACHSLGYVNLFVEGMSAGKGWISLAAIILVNGNPLGIALISLIFGFFDGLGLFLQGTGIPLQFTAMVPYLATLAALFVYSTRKKKRLSVSRTSSWREIDEPNSNSKAWQIHRGLRLTRFLWTGAQTPATGKRWRLSRGAMT